MRIADETPRSAAVVKQPGHDAQGTPQALTATAHQPSSAPKSAQTARPKSSANELPSPAQRKQTPAQEQKIGRPVLDSLSLSDNGNKLKRPSDGLPQQREPAIKPKEQADQAPEAHRIEKRDAGSEKEASKGPNLKATEAGAPKETDPGRGHIMVASDIDPYPYEQEQQAAFVQNYGNKQATPHQLSQLRTKRPDGSEISLTDAIADESWFPDNDPKKNFYNDFINDYRHYGPFSPAPIFSNLPGGKKEEFVDEQTAQKFWDDLYAKSSQGILKNAPKEKDDPTYMQTKFRPVLEEQFFRKMGTDGKGARSLQAAMNMRNVPIEKQAEVRAMVGRAASGNGNAQWMNVGPAVSRRMVVFHKMTRRRHL